ncbi:hypothetical protein [Streptosporangium sp. NPDC002524]|uniref:hypothetical protein n=1 Tax=Streptosporangium sp. NPDC002524 TaxID=3154537 RepID=UPI00332309EB
MIRGIVVAAISLILGGVAVVLALRSGKSMPAALLMGLTIAIGALGGLAALL